MKKRSIIILICLLLVVISGITSLLYFLNYLPHKKYTNADFNIVTYKSNVDKDSDGIDDQTDILNSVRKYLDAKPKYKSKYYDGGYPTDNYGVCTDVVAFGLKGSGYDLRELVDMDIRNNKDNYDIDKIDKNIDFRRVKNLQVYFKNNAINLTTDISNIGIISDKRNRKGIPFLIHHANPYQRYYEEDVLERYEIIGHFRVS